MFTTILVLEGLPSLPKDVPSLSIFSKFASLGMGLGVLVFYSDSILSKKFKCVTSETGSETTLCFILKGKIVS